MNHIRAWLVRVHERRTDRYLAKHSRHAGAQTTKGTQKPREQAVSAIETNVATPVYLEQMRAAYAADWFGHSDPR